MRCGFEQAEQEGVSVPVIAVPGQKRFYRACGFEKIVGTTNDEGREDNSWRKARLEAGLII